MLFRGTRKYWLGKYWYGKSKPPIGVFFLMIVNNWPGFFSTPATLFGSHQPLCMWRTQKPSLTTLGDLYISATIFLRFLLQLCHELCNLSWLYTCHLPCHVAPCKCWTVCSALQVICLTTYFYFINLFIYFVFTIIKFTRYYY